MTIKPHKNIMLSYTLVYSQVEAAPSPPPLQFRRQLNQKKGQLDCKVQHEIEWLSNVHTCVLKWARRQIIKKINVAAATKS